jgi:protein-tyrosine phosphatase
VTLPDIPNFRDAGGLQSGALRPGVIFRSAQLSGHTAADDTALIGLGVRSVYDLRTTDEAEHRPNTVPPSVRVTLLDVLADRPHSGAAAVASLVTAKQDGTTISDINDAVSGGRARDLMIETYRHFVSLPSAHASYRTLLASLADDRGASVIHCTAGKDRTGWAVAVLQRMCGADLDDIIADYLGSNAGMERAYRPMLESFAAQGGDAEALADMIFVKPEYLDAAITLMHHVHGGLDRYLTATLGLDAATLERLRTRLT